MSQKTITRGGQYPITAEFTFDVAVNTMRNVSGAMDNFRTVGSHVFDVIDLPPGAVVVGGEVTTDTAVSGSTTYAVSVGDANVPNRYLNAANRVAAGRSALTLTGFLSVGEPIRLTVSPTAADATGGVLSLRVMYIIRNRVNEV